MIPVFYYLFYNLRKFFNSVSLTSFRRLVEYFCFKVELLGIFHICLNFDINIKDKNTTIYSVFI